MEIPPELYCSVCNNLMVTKEHLPIKLEPCKHTVCQKCATVPGFINCPFCNCFIGALVANREMIDEYEDLMKDEVKQQNEKCIIIENGTNLVLRDIYQCQTCGPCDEGSICEACARTCHRGHILYPMKSEFCSGCACGQGFLQNPCKCLAKEEDRLICSTQITKEPIRQHCFTCQSCACVKICNACASKCHKNHILQDCGIDEFICTCGNGITGVRCMMNSEPTPRMQIQPL